MRLSLNCNKAERSSSWQSGGIEEAVTLAIVKLKKKKGKTNRMNIVNKHMEDKPIVFSKIKFV